MRVKVIHKVTYPNGKIYVGMGLTGSCTNFGSPRAAVVAADFTPDQLRRFMVTKETLWESARATDAEVRAKEVEFILAERSNDPAIGYNQWPRFHQSP